MSYYEIIEQISKESGIDENDLSDLLDDFFRILVSKVASGEEVDIHEFGKFDFRDTKRKGLRFKPEWYVNYFLTQ